VRAHTPAVQLYGPKNPNLPMRAQARKKKIIHLDPRHTFKALSLDTLIPTPLGFRRMEDIKLGDIVYGDDGKPCNVVGESPIYFDRSCVELEFSSHEKIICDEDHLWETDARNDRDRKKRRKTPCTSYPTIKTTREIVDTLLCRGQNNHRIKVCQPVSGTRRKFTVRPYVLGVWIGDGTTGSGLITLPTEQKGDVIEQLKVEGEILNLRTHESRSQTCYVKNLGPRLRSIGCLETKIIPRDYINASIKQRTSLLQGLMDTDGGVGTGGECFFSTSRYELALQVRELVASLGLKPTIFQFQAFIGERSYGLAYRVRFMAYRENPVFRSKRHLLKMANLSSRNFSQSFFRQIVAAKKVESEPVKCIAVDSPNKLYLAGEGFIPTHNTSLKRVDRAMWIAAFPEDITILNNSATQPLAEAVSVATAGLFYKAPGESNSALHLMFPELLTLRDPNNSPSKQKWVWNTNVRRRGTELDATLAYTSPKSTQSGWHPFMIDYDDVEDTNNSGIGVSPEVREHVIDVCDQNENLLRDGGYISIGGTRYSPLDWYGKQLELAEEYPDDFGVLVRASLKVKNGARILPGEFPAEEDVELLFSEYENLSYKSLRTKFMQNYEAYMCQQMNDPQGGNVPTFDERLYASCLVEAERVPFVGHSGEVFTCWRMQYGGKPGMAKYAEGAAAKIIDGKVYVIDCWQTTRTPSGMAELMVQAQKEHQAEAMMILDTPGSEYIYAHVRNEAARRNVSLRIQRTYWEEEDHRRSAQMRQLEPLMKVGRLLFATGMTKGAECHKQFVHFGLVEETGIIDCVAKFAEHVPMSQLRANMQEEEIEYQRKQRDNAMLTAFLDQQNMPSVDEQGRQKMEAHLQAMQAVSTMGGIPPLPGGLDG
jgi:hypothetical protein